MKRRKKSILFSATLATAGLVAGSLIAINNNSYADMIMAKDFDELSGILSENLKVSASSLSEPLSTKILIVKTSDENVFKDSKYKIQNYGVIHGEYYSLLFDSEHDAAAAYILLKQDPAVKGIALNYTTSIDNTTPSNSSKKNYGVDMMKLDRYAQDLSSSTQTFYVAVIDSGIRPTHELFTENSSQDRLEMDGAVSYVNVSGGVCSNYDFDYYDENGHGTATAGLIAQSTPKNVKIVPIRVFDSTGTGPFLPVLCAANYASNFADVANMSLGFDISDADQETVNTLNGYFADFTAERGTIFVAATGNDGASTISFPASAPDVVAINSVDRNNNLSSYSNYGTGLDFSAPGQQMYVACHSTDTCYEVGSGTSFSSPLAAAAIADVKIEHPDYTKDQVLEVLKANALDLGAAGYDTKFGYGSISFRINRYADITFNSVNIPSGWAKTKRVSVAVSSGAAINQYAFQEGNITTMPNSWNNGSSASTSVNANFDITKNGNYTVWFKNVNGEYKSKVFTVSGIDTVVPTINQQLSAAKVSDNSQNLSITVSDDASGISSIEWYYKLSSASNYTKKVEEYSGETNATEKIYTLTNLAVGSYTAYATVIDRAGNSTTSNTTTFTVEAPADHVSIGNPTTPSGWINTDATISVAISSDLSNITHRAVISGNSTNEPAASNWVALSSPSKSLTDSFTVATNGTYTVWYKNGTESAHKTFTVSNIDKTAPVAKNIAISNITGSSAKASVTVSDTGSGIAKIEWKYKLVSDENYTTKVSPYTDGATAETTKSYTLTGLTAGNYVIFATVYDNVNQSASTGEINFEIAEAPEETDFVTISNVQVPNTWGKTSLVTVTVSSEKTNITHSALMTGSSTTTPGASDWAAVETPAKTLADAISLSVNGTFTIWYKNESGETAHETFTISKIDDVFPTIEEELSASEPEEKNITLSISADDAASGIAKIDWYYKLEGADKWTVETEMVGSSASILAVTPYTHTFSNLPAGNYVAYALITDRAGNEKQSGEIRFTIAGDPATEDPIDDNDDDDAEPSDTVVTNPKTDDGIIIVSAIGGVILAAGAVLFAKLRRVR